MEPDVMGPDGGPPHRGRWEEDGRESTIRPGTDAGGPAPGPSVERLIEEGRAVGRPRVRR